MWYGVRNGGNGLAVEITVKTEKKGEEKEGEDYIYLGFTLRMTVSADQSESVRYYATYEHE